MNAQDRYMAAARGIQSAIAYLMTLAQQRGDASIDPGTSHKHLRVGVNMTMVDNGAIARLLIDKGIIEEADYMEYVAQMAEKELADLTKRAREVSGIPQLTFG